MNWQLMIDSLPALLQGAVLTIQMLVISLLFGGMLAVPLAILSIEKTPFRLLVHCYIYVMRGTPLLVQLFFVYYGLAQFEFIRHSWAWQFLRSPYFCALFTFSIHTAAYSANILRGAIQGISHGEIEATLAIGMSKRKVYQYVVLPKAFRMVLPAYGNEVVGMLKGTSLASTVTLLELTGQAGLISAATFASYEFYLLIAVIYFCITFVITRIIKFLEYITTPERRPVTTRP